MSTTNGGDGLVFQVRNHHSAAAAHHRTSMTSSPNQYVGYFENQYGEQAVVVYDRDSSQAVLYLGDAGWETPHAVIDGIVPDLVLSETERQWLRACWQAATANPKEA